MKLKSTLLSALVVSSTLLGAEPMNSEKATGTGDWNTLSKNGFYESSNAKNAPLPGQIWFWGFNVAHSNSSAKYNGQIAFQHNSAYPKMFVRSTGSDGSGVWGRVFTDRDKAEPITSWNTLWRNGTFQGHNLETAPESNGGFFWGLNMAFSSNSENGHKNGAQILVKNTTLPTMYVRSKDKNGSGVWGKVLTSIPQKTTDWNSIWENGFYESSNNAPNSPVPGDWFWGINLGHTSNYGHEKLGEDYKFGAQIAFKGNHGGNPEMYIRSRGKTGGGTWGRVLTDLGTDGDFIVNGDIKTEEIRSLAGKTLFVGAKDDDIITGNGAGNVGIGFDYDVTGHGRPEEKLHVRGNIKATGRIMADYASLNNMNVKGNIVSHNSIECKRVKVSTAPGGADYVFEKDYDLKSLSEIESFIKENKHLPNVPSAKEFEERGMNLVEMNFKLLEKIEELTLHSIEQNKQLMAQNNKIQEFQEIIERNGLK